MLMSHLFLEVSDLGRNGQDQGHRQRGCWQAHVVCCMLRARRSSRSTAVSKQFKLHRAVIRQADRKLRKKI